MLNPRKNSCGKSHTIESISYSLGPRNRPIFEVTDTLSLSLRTGEGGRVLVFSFLCRVCVKSIVDKIHGRFWHNTRRNLKSL